MLYKYPRTYHLPWSPGATKDDKILTDIGHFVDKDVVVSVKMDGENSTLYSDHLHARSLDSKDHESRHWLKSFWAQKKFLIPQGWRICGENLFAQHSIRYDNLPSYFMVFSIWNDKNVCLSYADTMAFCMEHGFEHVPVIFRGEWRDRAFFDRLFTESYSDQEGYVIRISNEFRYEDFGKSAAKYVRVGHVQTDKHWMYKRVVPNKLG